MKPKDELDFIMNLHVNKYKCKRCLYSLKIPIQTAGQTELFAPTCPYCGGEMTQENK